MTFHRRKNQPELRLGISHRKTLSVSVTDADQIVLCKEIIAVCHEKHRKIRTFCVQNRELVIFESGAACSNY
jgi:hypothetical protein